MGLTLGASFSSFRVFRALVFVFDITGVPIKDGF